MLFRSINSSSAMATLTVSEKENTDITQEPEATPSQTTTTPPAPGDVYKRQANLWSDGQKSHIRLGFE